MKKLFILGMLNASLLLALLACNDDKTADSMDGKADSTGQAMTAEEKEERNKATALASVEGVNAHNVDQMLKEVSPDAIDYGDGTMKPVKGMDSIRASINGWLAAFPDVKGENLKAVADGEWVMVWGDWSGTWKGDFAGQKATNKSYKIKDVDIFRFNDEGKITEHHIVQSWMSVAPQIGMKMQ